jgi:hypothetical protein
MNAGDCKRGAFYISPLSKHFSAESPFLRELLAPKRKKRHRIRRSARYGARTHPGRHIVAVDIMIIFAVVAQRSDCDTRRHPRRHQPFHDPHRFQSHNILSMRRFFHPLTLADTLD